MSKYAAAAAVLIAALLSAAASPQAHAASLTVQTKSPAAGSIVSGNIVWEATVTGGTPSRVEFLIDGSQKWSESNAPFRYNGDSGFLDTRTLADGSHTLTARAVATTGETFTSAVTVTVANNPVAISTPAANATLSGSVVWEAKVTIATSRVEFLIDGSQKWTETSAPYRYNGDTGFLDTRTLADGSHTLTARAVATSGETFTSAVTITVSNNPSGLGVTISTPTANAMLSGNVVWEAKVTAGTASQVDFIIDGTPKWTERGAPYRYNGDTGTLDTRTLTNGAHTLTVRALDSAGKSATSEIGVNVSNSANRTIYCFGSPTYGTLGWAWEGTSLGWIRQFPYGLPQRVAYDSTVSVMKGLGCETIKAEIQPNDPDTNGGTGPQRAQLYSTDSLLSRYGGQPSLGTVRGNYRWYAFAFATNSSYRPQNSSAYPNWNSIFTWHNTGSGTPNIGLNVATAIYDGCGGSLTQLSQPRLVVDLNGGDKAKFPYGGATCRRFFGPTFTPGARYTVQMGIKWADNGTGSFEIWINGQQVANVSNISNLWLTEGVYPLFQNYRPGKSQIGNLITWTNIVYYGGLVTGPTRADVALPSN